MTIGQGTPIPRKSPPKLFRIEGFVSTTSVELRTGFFEWLFGDTEGYVCLAHAQPTNARKSFRHKFFHWPTQKEDLLRFCLDYEKTQHLWFAVNLLNQAKLAKENCLPNNLVWSDLDTCNPSIVEPSPSLILVSSPNRYQAIWKLDQVVPPIVAEDYSKRIAYKYKQDGADPTGWDLVQLLRIPFSKNFKYDEEPLVLLNAGGNMEVSVTEFEEIESAPIAENIQDSPDAPDHAQLASPDSIIYKYQNYLERSFFELYEVEPTTDNDWSSRMWKLINDCFEAGMEAEEVYSIALHAKCNKYIRDNRPIRFLWIEVLKAQRVQQKIDEVAGEWRPLLMPRLVDEDKVEHDTFIDRYHSWASSSTDAVQVYHELAAAILLSATLSSHIRLDTSYGSFIPNLWGLVLGESTLTRKTTAMQMAMSLLREVDPEAEFANDGSAEGMLSRLSDRPGRTSIFYKDEVSGLFDKINRQDYLAGIPEMFTQLYDGHSFRRILRKEEIWVQNPIFIFFGGGIAEKTYSHLSEQFVLSGFLPRFLVVNGSADLGSLRRTGPQNLEGMTAREKIVNELRDLREIYTPSGNVTIGGQVVPLIELSDRPLTKAILTTEAWDTYGAIEFAMIEEASQSHFAMMALPTFERMSRSLLKLAVLLAASRQEPKDSAFDVEQRDIENAARYIQKWGKYSVELLLNVGKTDSLRLLEKVRKVIDGRPGIFKSELMRLTHLSSKQMTEVITTLIDRGEINRKPAGKRSEQYWIVH